MIIPKVLIGPSMIIVDEQNVAAMRNSRWCRNECMIFASTESLESSILVFIIFLKIV